jgi:hypothetical protein
VSDAAPATAPTPAARERRQGDRLAVAAIVLGATVALVGVRVPLTLTTGCAIALAGVLLAIRGDRPVPAPALLGLALTVAIVAIGFVALIAVWEEWQIGQQLAEGAPVQLVQSAVRPYVRLVAALRSLSLFCGLSLLLGAALTRVGGSGK